MDNNRGQTIFLSVIGIATLLVAIIGATFAYFSITVTGNENASSIFITTAVLGEVTFTDGTEIKLDKIRPEDDKTLNPNEATKTFTVAYTGTEELTKPIIYQIKLEMFENTISPDAQTGWFVHSLTGTSNKAGTDGDVLVSLAQTDVPAKGTEPTQLGANGQLNAPGTTHTYSYNIHLLNVDTNQNAVQGKSFVGRLQVFTVDEAPAAPGA